MIPAAFRSAPSFFVSCISGDGIPLLVEEVSVMAQRIVRNDTTAESSAAITRPRHRLAVQDTVSSIGDFFEAPYLDAGAAELQIAAARLGSIMGDVDVEEMLDVIFQDFCVGK